MDYMTAQFSSLCVKHLLDSVCFVVAVFYWHSFDLFPRDIPDKLIDQKISIMFLARLYKMLLIVTKYYSTPVERE
jgi:hypothetical protein